MSHQISPKSFEITPKGNMQGQIVMSNDGSPTTSQRVIEVNSLIGQQKLNSPLGVTIINNDYSNINFTQNFNIEKYVKQKKKNNNGKKKYAQVIG